MKQFNSRNAISTQKQYYQPEFHEDLAPCSYLQSLSICRVHRHATEDSLGNSNVRHKIVVMGSAKVGKSSLITQFLYNRFSPKYKRTVEEMHQGNFNVSGVGLILDILDTSGAYEVGGLYAPTSICTYRRSRSRSHPPSIAI